METAQLLLIILAVFVAFFLAVFQYIFKNKEKSQLNYWLSFLRFLSWFAIFLLLINPSIKNETYEIIKPKLLIALDNSSSIKYSFQDINVKNLLTLIQTDTDLNSKFSIDYYSFGAEFKNLDSLSFKENQTDLFTPLNEFTKVYSKAINPVVLITDGNQTIGNTVEFSNYKNPVFAFIVGDTTTVEDIFINQLNVNENTFINNQFPVEVFINYVGNKSFSKNLSVYNNGNRLYSKQLNFSKTDNVKTESFFLTAEKKGNQYYSVKIESLENEKNIVNNAKDFSINVIEEKSEILILTDIVHPDLGMLKKSIERKKQHNVTVLDIDSNIKISDYQLIILYQPNKKFKKIFENISVKNNNYFIISGTNTDWAFLNSVQNIFEKKALQVTENFNPVFNESYTSFISKDIGFANFAPLEDAFGSVIFSIPYQTLLFQKIGNIVTEEPLLVTFENKSQRAGVLFGENVWRWRMNSFNENKNFELFDGFISNLIQYLASDFKSEKLNVIIKPLYFSNETIQVSANYFDDNFNLDTRVKLWLTVSDKENNYINKIPFSLVKNRFIAELSNIPAAEYSYKVSVENEKELILGSFKVLPFEIEQQFTQSNDQSLKTLTSKTNGTVYYNNQEFEMINNLKTDDRFKSIQKSSIKKIPIIDWQWILGFIVLVLSIEWFTRKYFGKI